MQSPGSAPDRSPESAESSSEPAHAVTAMRGDDGRREPATSRHEKSFHASRMASISRRVGKRVRFRRRRHPNCPSVTSSAVRSSMRPRRRRDSSGTATTTSARIIGSAYWGVSGATLVSDNSATAPTAMSRALGRVWIVVIAAAPGQRGSRDSARQRPRPRDEVRIVDLDRARAEVARHRVGNPEQSDRAVDRGEGGSDIAATSSSPPISAHGLPAASPTQSQSSGSPHAVVKAAARSASTTSAIGDEATRSARFPTARRRAASRRSSTIAGNGSIVIQIGASEGSSSAASASSVVAASSIRMSRSSVLGERVACLAQVLDAHDLAVALAAGRRCRNRRRCRRSLDRGSARLHRSGSRRGRSPRGV